MNKKRVIKFILNAIHLYSGLFFFWLFSYYTTYLLLECKEVCYMVFSAILIFVMAILGAFVGFYLFDKILKLFGYER